MSLSMRLLQSRNYQRWCLTTTHLVQRISGLCKRTEMPFPEFCKIYIFTVVNYETIMINYVPLIFHNTSKYWYGENMIENYTYRFRPRILIDVSKIDMTTTVLGFKISMPIMIAPTAMQKMAHPEGIIVSPLHFLKVNFQLWLVCVLPNGMTKIMPYFLITFWFKDTTFTYQFQQDKILELELNNFHSHSLTKWHMPEKVRIWLTKQKTSVIFHTSEVFSKKIFYSFFLSLHCL